MSEITTPVLIVGGGPVGLAASICLSQFGVPSLLVEQHATTTTHPKATVVNTRTFELFRQWGIEDEVRADGLSSDKARFIVWATSLTGYELGRLDLAAGFADDPATALRELGRQSPTVTSICPQDVYEPILRRKAETGSGAVVRFGTRLVTFSARDDGVDATIESLASGRTETVRAQYLLACDGAASGIREQLGVAMQGPDNIGSLLNIYFHADLTSHIAGREGPLYWIVNAETPGVFIALDNRTRWLFNTPVRLRPGESTVHFSADFCRAMVRRAVGARDLEVDVRSVDPWVMRAQVAERYRAGRVFLLGDAAHRFPPTGGFGMNTGVQDAHNLAWKIAGVVRGWASPALLDTYEAERQPVGQFNADQSLKNAKQMPRPIAAGASSQNSLAIIDDDSPEGEKMRHMIAAGIEKTREHFSAAGQAKGFAYESPAITPDPSLASEARSSVETYVPTARPGSQAPHVWIRADGRLRSMLDLFTTRFVVLTADRGERWRSAVDQIADRALLDVVRVGTDVLLDQNNTADWCELYGIGEDGAVLVRPDGHVAWRTRTMPGAPDAELARAFARARGL